MSDPVIDNGDQPNDPCSHQILSPYSRMFKFITEAGGKVRFDAYCNEHNLGEAGFYSHGIDLSSDHSPVQTPMNFNPGYRYVYAHMVLREAKEVAFRTDSNKVLICEIGPGGGELCEEILAQFERAKSHLFPLEAVDYIAVDPNERHVNALKERGVPATVGIGQKLPFEDNSVGIIVAEEVLDELPFRILNWDKVNKCFTGEVFVEIDNDHLKLTDDFLERDPRIDALEKYLANNNYDQPRYRYSPEYPKFWGELRRVLNPQGIAFISDYGTDSLLHSAFTGLEHESNALRKPYGVDLTHVIDFRLQGLIARAQGFGEISVNTRLDQFAQAGDLMTAMQVEISGRKFIRASGNRLESRAETDNPKPISTEELYALGNNTPGVRNVLRLLSSRKEAEEVVTIFKKHGLAGGAFWIIYSDIAGRNIDKFIELVLAEDQRSINWAKDQMDLEDHVLASSIGSLPITRPILTSWDSGSI